MDPSVKGIYSKIVSDVAESLVCTILYNLCNSINIKRIGKNHKHYLLIQNVKSIPEKYRMVIRRDSYVEVKARGNPLQWIKQGVPPEKGKFYEKMNNALKEGRDYILAYLFYDLDINESKLWFKLIMFNAEMVDDNWFIITTWPEPRSKEKKIEQLSIEKIPSLKPPHAIVFETRSPFIYSK
ncbi:MAG: hypothetical protein J7L82_04865 [Staphylothermus sp.]|nr:hypothetical protein [Staphylothermus sp.]